MGQSLVGRAIGECRLVPLVALEISVLVGYFLERILDCGKVYFVSICFACAKYLPGGKATFSFFFFFFGGSSLLSFLSVFLAGWLPLGCPPNFRPRTLGLNFCCCFFISVWL